MSRVPVLVVGVPRSGSSWVGRVLGSTTGAAYLGEPDNHEHSAFALRAKLGLPGRFYTELAVGDEAPAYAALWANAYGTRADSPAERVRRKLAERLLRRAADDDVRHSLERGRYTTAGLRLAAALAVPERPPAGDCLVVKSVYAQLALDWIADRFPVRVAVVLREPLNVLSSWKAMGWLRPGTETLAELGPATVARLEERFGIDATATGSIEQAATLIALLHTALVDAARRHPDWLVLVHEDLCAQPHDRFEQAAGALGLRWDASVDTLLDELNRPGTGYETARVASDLTDVWRSRLTPEEEDAARQIFRRYREVAGA